MRNIKIAALQFSCCSQVQENIDKAETMVHEAASNGANLILLPELFERPYFCQEKRYDYYDYALPLTENPAVRRFQAVAGELGVDSGRFAKEMFSAHPTPLPRLMQDLIRLLAFTARSVYPGRSFLSRKIPIFTREIRDSRL